MATATSPFEAFSADGHDVTWTTWDGDHAESFTLRWENEAWTATGQVARENVQYVLRIAPTWHVRQFLLFRDLDEPDLWLAIDAKHRWGEVNGVFRPEFDGCADIGLSCTPFAATVPIRRLALGVGESAEIAVIVGRRRDARRGVGPDQLRAHRRPLVAGDVTPVGRRARLRGRRARPRRQRARTFHTVTTEPEGSVSPQRGTTARRGTRRARRRSRAAGA